jgi:hypothetical protein
MGFLKVLWHQTIWTHHLQLHESCLAYILLWNYRNPNLGLTTKARACKGVGQEWIPKVTFHAPKSVGKCEEWTSTLPKWAPTLGVRIMMDSQIFRVWIQGQNSLNWSFPYIIENLLECRCLKCAHMTYLGN